MRSESPAVRRRSKRTRLAASALHFEVRLGLSAEVEVWRGCLGSVEVACKRLLPHACRDAAALVALRAEAAALAAIGGWPAATLAAAALGGGVPWLATRWIEGAPLRALLVDGRGGSDGADPARHGGVDGPGGADAEALQALRLRALCGLWQALAALHAAGWIHGDVSAANAVLGADGRVTLIDLAAASRQGAAAAPRGRGTPAYAAPEVATGAALLPASDVFAAARLTRRLLAPGLPTPPELAALLAAAEGIPAQRPPAATVAAAATLATGDAWPPPPAADRLGAALAPLAAAARAGAPPIAAADERPGEHTDPGDSTATRALAPGDPALAALLARLGQR